MTRRIRPKGRRERNPGRRVDQTRWVVDERRQTTVALTRAGWSANEIAVRLGVDQRTVFRYRQEARQMQYRLAS
jgi:DNA-binding NarL/FixJ family response regulator